MFFKITDYADELYEGLNDIDWPETTKTMQRNWIGKSHGTEIMFEVFPQKDSDKNTKWEKWKIFTTRPDTIFGVTFMVISAQHKKLDKLVSNKRKKDVEEFLKDINSVSGKDISKLEKKGIFTGSYAKNPATGKTIPIYAGNFVVADYGSGMVMGVPAHDQRDYDFASKYNIDILKVIEGGDIEKEAYVAEGELINSGDFDGMDNNEAKERITQHLESKGLGKKVVNFKLRDWGISRQRYWGTPIPIIHCKSCGTVPVPEDELPVKLPRKVKFGDGNPLLTNEKWVNVKCPKCGKKAKRETDTMDTFVNSSWYFLRFCDPNNDESIFDSEKVKSWCPVDRYVGGQEHACMHLIYSRFYVKFLRDLGMFDFGEPFASLFHQGMLHAEDGSKMSKSKGNVVLPESVSDKYGIDTARFFLSSLASPDKDIDWSERGIIGSLRFVKRIFGVFDSVKIDKDSAKLESKVNEVVRNVSKYYDEFLYRKATIEIRELFDLIASEKEASMDTLEKFLKLLSPICPHISEELWEKLGNKVFVSDFSWPEFDESKIEKKSEMMDLNGKIIERVKGILKKGTKKVYVYVMPFEGEGVDVGRIGAEIEREVEVFTVNDSEKIDPKNMAKKAKPGMPSVYLE